MIDLSTPEELQEFLKGEDGPRVTPRLIEPKPPMEQLYPVQNLSQTGLDGLGPLLRTGVSGVLVHSYDMGRIQSADPVREEIHLVVLRDHGMGPEACHGGVNDSVLVRLQFLGEYLLGQAGDASNLLEDFILLRVSSFGGLDGLEEPDMLEVILEMVSDLVS